MRCTDGSVKLCRRLLLLDKHYGIHNAVASDLHVGALEQCEELETSVRKLGMDHAWDYFRPVHLLPYIRSVPAVVMSGV